MLKIRFTSAIAVALLVTTLAGVDALGQTGPQKPKQFLLLNFDEVGCRAKGRLQDKEYCESKLMDQIIAQGKSSIPILISQLTDTRRTKVPIFDFWDYTAVGDVASSILIDLFTDSDWTTFNMPDLESIREGCDDDVPGWVCWHKFVKKHGRKFIQDRWLAAWNSNKDRIYWDEKARCFRVSPKAK